MSRPVGRVPPEPSGQAAGQTRRGEARSGVDGGDLVSSVFQEPGEGEGGGAAAEAVAVHDERAVDGARDLVGAAFDDLGEGAERFVRQAGVVAGHGEGVQRVVFVEGVGERLVDAALPPPYGTQTMRRAA